MNATEPTAAANRLVIDSTGRAPDWEAWGHEVRKIVLGPSPGESDAKPLKLDKLPADLARRFPSLTHLYFWRLEGLRALPALPATLECLDLRGCADLTELPALPEALETLDLGDCVKLARLPAVAPPALRRFYFNGCTALKTHSLAAFLEALQAAPVVELDGSGAAVASLEEFPRTALRKLVLRGCARLGDVSAVVKFPALEHLDLGGCTALESLPDLPPRLRYLVLHGADKLRFFMGQDIGPYDRGADYQDVAKAFLSRKKFGRELAIMPHAKLLLMGDGRVGKTTLAKRLQWEELGLAERRQAGNRELQPSRDETFTHKVRFWRWETGLALLEAEATALEERAAAAGLALPRRSDGALDGAVRIWDFGGQEIYHNTHRIFAGEGSLFLLVWREDPPPVGAPPGDVTPEEWREWNRPRPLDYWLDYIYSMRPDAQVALVCTNCPDPDRLARKPDWKPRAPKHAHRDLPSFCVDSLDDAAGQHTEYRRLVRWIREASGREAKRIGILQPRFYRQVSDLLDRWLTENSRAGQEDAPAAHLLCSWDQWQASIREAHRAAGANHGLELDADDIVAITDYLHEAGHLFQVRQAAQRSVLVDQEWAAELIYRLLLPGGQLRQTVKHNGGWFYRSELESDALWKALDDGVQRERLLAYMEECRVVTRIGEARQQRLGEDVFLASDKWLLPAFEVVAERIEHPLSGLRQQPGVAERAEFEFGALTPNEFDFRRLQAHLARTFGTRAIYFRNGFQAASGGHADAWCLRVRWLPREAEAFEGTIDAVLVARRRDVDRIGLRLEDLFFAEGSPLADRRPAVKRRLAEGTDVQPEYFRRFRAIDRKAAVGARGAEAVEADATMMMGMREEFDVALSSSGADGAEAEAAVKALTAAGFRVSWYRLPECRVDDRAAVLGFMNSLSRQPCILLLLSESYLRDDPFTNWYCVWELADAIRQLGGGQRSAAQTLVMYKSGPGLDSKRLNEIVVRLLNLMGEYFANAYAGIPFRDRANFEHYDRFSRHYVAALEQGNCGKFFAARGTLGSYLRVPADPGKPHAFRPLIEAVAAALGRQVPVDRSGTTPR